MKKLIYTCLMVGLAAGLTACKKDSAADPPAPPQEEPAEADTTPSREEPLPTTTDPVPDAETVRVRLLPELAGYPATRPEAVQMDALPQDDGSVLITARVRVSVGENLYEREPAPEALNEERRAMNEAVNLAMMPEAHYLLQVGATSEDITDEDRRPKPLPENLQQQADAIRNLAERPLYHLRVPADTRVELPATMTARLEGGQWVFSQLSLDTATLHAWAAYIPEAALPQGAPVMRDGVVDELRETLRKMVAEFNQAAEPGIQAREEAARSRMLEQRARRQEQEAAEAERAAAQAAAHEAWEKICAAAVLDGAVYEGEWKRHDHFGKLALRMVRTQKMPEAVQFTGVIYDPDMTQAELQVVGRVEQAPRAGDPLPVVVHIYHGRYDPDVPTAEVFDAGDSLLKLQLAENGKLSGVMTCAAWQDSPDKAFAVSLALVPKKPARRSPATPARRSPPKPAKPAAP